MKKVAIITINLPGEESATKLVNHLRPINETFQLDIFTKKREEKTKSPFSYDNLDSLLDEIWRDYDVLLCFLATGIVVRKIASRLKSKTEDPAILVMSFDLSQVIPLLSGHLGGANAFSELLTKHISGCVSFISTATDQTNHFAFDLFAQENGFIIENIKQLAPLSNALINEKSIQVITYPAIMDLIKRFKGYKESLFQWIDLSGQLEDINPELEQVILSPLSHNYMNKVMLRIRIPSFYLGMGMDRGVSCEALTKALKQFTFEHNLNIKHLKGIASFSAKSDELGLLELAANLNVPLEFYEEGEINGLEMEFSKSRAMDFFNIKGVAEPSAILASRHKTLFLLKHIYPSITISAAF